LLFADDGGFDIGVNLVINESRNFVPFGEALRELFAMLEDSPNQIRLRLLDARLRGHDIRA
jgi:hypothetical protein